MSQLRCPQTSAEETRSICKLTIQRNEGVGAKPDIPFQYSITRREKKKTINISFMSADSMTSQRDVGYDVIRREVGYDVIREVDYDVIREVGYDVIREVGYDVMTLYDGMKKSFLKIVSEHNFTKKWILYRYTYSTERLNNYYDFKI